MVMRDLNTIVHSGWQARCIRYLTRLGIDTFGSFVIVTRSV